MSERVDVCFTLHTAVFVGARGPSGRSPLQHIVEDTIKLLIRLLLDLIRVMSTSLQNFHYFPPFCMLPQADELDPNYYSENGQGMWLHIGSQLIVHVPRKILEYETKNLHGCVSCREITPLFRHAPPFTDLVLCSRNRERCSFASSGSGAPVRDGQVVEL